MFCFQLFSPFPDAHSFVVRSDYHQKQSLKYAIKASESILKIKELCLVEKKNFKDFLKECDINWNKSYVYFLISFYHFSKDYPKICNVSLSIYFIMSNFKSIKLAIWSSKDEREYWKSRS
jgi:hypothetical protein